MDIEFARTQMLGQQVRAWEVLDERVLDALGSVPREQFVPPAYRDLAFADTAIPLAHGEEMMAPKIEGRLLQALRLDAADQVLEIGTGTGFLTACLGRLADRVTSLDIHEDFINDARGRLTTPESGRLQLVTADVFRFEPSGPFDAIVLAGSLPSMDERLLQWLAPGGRLFAVVGQAPIMEAVLYTRRASDHFTRDSLFETMLKPLRNAPEPTAFRF